LDENFTQAALRHVRDARLLEQEKRIENADQLYGLAAECAIKSTLPPNSSDTHIKDLWGKSRNHPTTDPKLAAVLKGDGTVKKYNPFNDWEISQRYCCNGYLSFDSMDKHKKATEKIMFAIGITGVRQK